MRLHLGCGNIKKEGWVNIDIKSGFRPDIVTDVAMPLPFPDDIADEIECCHLFEHLSYAEAVPALRDWHRVLKRGGRFSIELLDFDKRVELYKERRR